MRRILLFVMLLCTVPVFSQLLDIESRLGVTAGANQYYMNADFLFSRSATGFQVGVVSSMEVSKNSEIQVEFNYSRYSTELIGRETELSNSEWIKFNLDRFNLSVIYDYELVHFLKEDIALGLCAGPSMAMLNDFKIDDDSKSHYLLDPYYVPADYLEMDTKNEQTSINVFGVVGITGRYRNFEANLRYAIGITDVYRVFPGVSAYTEFTGKDNYGSLTLTYFFGKWF
ncbi:MAG: outer membrane beta-barrel protein [Flavobacterium sp.]